MVYFVLTVQMEITILPDKYQKDLCKSNYDLQKVYKHHRREYTLKEQTNELLSSKSSPNTLFRS